MQIIPIHYRASAPVRGFRSIQEDAEEMIAMLDRGNFEGLHPNGAALAHCQVEHLPFAFFVVSRALFEEGAFKHRVIMNPQILDAPVYLRNTSEEEIGLPNALRTPNASECIEACLSFPHKRAKRMHRFNRIKVTYKIPGRLFDRSITTWLEGFPSQVFQHEFDHCQGQNMFFKNYE